MATVAIINNGKVGKGVEEGGKVGVENGTGSVAVAYIMFLIQLKSWRLARKVMWGMRLESTAK